MRVTPHSHLNGRQLAGLYIILYYLVRGKTVPGGQNCPVFDIRQYLLLNKK